MESFSKKILRVVVAQLNQAIGWHSIQTTSLEIMSDILHRYLEELGKNIHRYSEQFGHTEPNLDDVGLAFRDMGISLHELEEYIRNVDYVACTFDVPKFPIPRESHLNFLKPGSREVVTRPVHVHEHLPPMHPEMEEEDYGGKQAPLLVDTSASSCTGATSPLASPKSSVFKRPGDPVSVENPALKRARHLLEEEGRPLREISSVMMTTSGFLSPAREGKLPESRTPLQPSDSRSNSPQPSSYPMVPPEVKGEKKYKKVPLKRASDSAKKLDKENKKKVKGDDSRVKKLASMKELSKLKPLKPGAWKMAHLTAAGPSHVKSKAASKVGTRSGGSSKSAKGNHQTKSATATVSFVPRATAPLEKVRDSVIDGKLLAEPDKQKLNIFKKIPKVKEDKTDKQDRMDLFEAPSRDSRESSPGLVIDESEVSSRQREARMAQIEDCIDAVIQRSKELADSKEHKASMGGPQEQRRADSGPPDTSGPQADSDHDIYLFDDDLFPPGTPSTPKTPELVMSVHKGDKGAEPREFKEKKKKKDKSKSKKELKMKMKGAPSPKKGKVDVVECTSPDRPKTPEGPECSETAPAPVFPFFSHFPPAPGLIPPPIVHPLFQRYPLPMGKNLPHPAMPNLPMPPPLFMQSRSEEAVDPAAPMGPAGPITPTARPDKEKAAPSSVSPPKEKSYEKKVKEHKKDKKDKDKTKKKKDRKDKMKGKEEKKKIKGEKKERDKEKIKEKKDKKEKRKDKEREEKMETGVPKITLKLGPASPRPPTPDAGVHRIVIKSVVKKQPACGEEENEIPAGMAGSENAFKREPSPELARISALVTRPPRQKASKSKPEKREDRPPAPTPSSLPCGSPALLEGLWAAGKGTDSGSSVAGAGAGAGLGSGVCVDNEGKKVWFCPACGGQDDGSPMIGCDDCDAWYHWVCVGIQVPPDENEDWYCRVCIVKKQEHHVDKKKKSRKRKMMT